MPTYDYVCKLCGHHLELFQSMSEAPKKKCPKCAKNGLERQIGAGAGFIFKGSGFYLTDYRSDSYKSGEQAASKGSADAAGSGASESSGDSSGAAAKEPSGSGTAPASPKQAAPSPPKPAAGSGPSAPKKRPKPS